MEISSLHCLGRTASRRHRLTIGCLLITRSNSSRSRHTSRWQLQHQQHVVSLTPFWPSDPAAWFRLAEGTFKRLNVHDVHLCVDYVLPALLESALTQLCNILGTADALPNPYDVLKAELIWQFSPTVHEQLNKIVFAPELGRQAPTPLMRTLLACLPTCEPPGLLFKQLFLLKLHGDLRDQVGK